MTDFKQTQQIIGKSVQGRDISEFRCSVGEPRRRILFLGGVHGDEIEGVWLMQRLQNGFSELIRSLPNGGDGLMVSVVSAVNPDGIFLKTRVNANGVDLNRNLPTADWTSVATNPRYPPGSAAASEPENQCLVGLIDEFKPHAILSAHSFSRVQVNANGSVESGTRKVAKAWANELSKLCQYPVTEDIGYPTPGSLGTYAGEEKKIPTITLEIEKGLDRERVIQIHIPVLVKTLDFWIGSH